MYEEVAIILKKSYTAEEIYRMYFLLVTSVAKGLNDETLPEEYWEEVHNAIYLLRKTGYV